MGGGGGSSNFAGGISYAGGGGSFSSSFGSGGYSNTNNDIITGTQKLFTRESPATQSPAKALRHTVRDVRQPLSGGSACICVPAEECPAHLVVSSSPFAREDLGGLQDPRNPTTQVLSNATVSTRARRDTDAALPLDQTAVASSAVEAAAAAPIEYLDQLALATHTHFAKEQKTEDVPSSEEPEPEAQDQLTASQQTALTLEALQAAEAPLITVTVPSGYPNIQIVRSGIKVQEGSDPAFSTPAPALAKALAPVPRPVATPIGPSIIQLVPVSPTLAPRPLPLVTRGTVEDVTQFLQQDISTNVRQRWWWLW